ncbi:MAG: hypothetical protein IPG80_21365 [Anaerolineales bacterium]|uniref:hypothetical protein n=1 Tax=Candidatus Villigracilis vicinus TaxID=3140679 RepID=UPI0031372F5D|nr:hypothetical protein [Anaerolineales bacterium]
MSKSKVCTPPTLTKLTWRVSADSTFNAENLVVWRFRWTKQVAWYKKYNLKAVIKRNRAQARFFI